MADERFKILFRGDLAEGYRRDEVKQKLMTRFGLKAETVDALLDGQTATLKKNLDREGALKFKQAFEKTGAICYIRPMDDSVATTSPRPPSVPLSRPSPPPPASQPLRSESESFTVVATEGAPEDEAIEPEPIFQIPPGPAPGTMTCPKCSFVQPSADFCEACGVVILKYLKRQWEEERLARQLEEAQRSSEAIPAAAAPPEPAVEPRPAAPPVTPRSAPAEPAQPRRDEPDAFTVADASSAPDAKGVESDPEPVFEIPPGPSPGTMTCPKCSFVQPSADFCEACGVVVLKYLKRQWEEEQLDRQFEETQSDTEEPVSQAETPSAPETSRPVEAPQGETVPSRIPPESTQREVPVTVPPGPTPGTMTCPKCSFVQPAADTCAACGVVILKYLQRMATESQQAATPTQGGDDDRDQEGDLAPPPRHEEDSSDPLIPRSEQAAALPVAPFHGLYRRAGNRIRGVQGQIVPLWLGALLLVALSLHYHPSLASRLPAPYPPLLTGVLIVLLLSLATNATLHLLADPFLQLRPALALGLIRLGSFLWLHGWLLVILCGGTLALVVPGYLFARWFCLAPCCFAAEASQGLSCLLRSRAYAVGREKWLGKGLLQTLPLPLVTVAGITLLPGMLKLIALLPLPLFLALLTEIYQDAAATRPQLSYDDRLVQRVQWPVFGLAGMLVFTILAVLVFGSGRIRSSLYAVSLHAGLVRPPSSSTSGDARATTPVRDYTSGVVELVLNGYQAHVYLNGEQIQAHEEGGAAQRSFSSPVILKPGRNLLAVRYEPLTGADHPEMQLRVFRWNLAELKDENLGRWKINDNRGLRRFEFTVKKPAEARQTP